MSVIISIALATMCFTNSVGVSECHPVLIGNNTVPGSYNLVERRVLSPGYGGNVLKYRETETSIYSIHRTWLGKPSQRRLERLASPNPSYRVITEGCINVEPAVFDRLVDCCSNSQLEIID